jgi:hypothetical protein
MSDQTLKLKRYCLTQFVLTETNSERMLKVFDTLTDYECPF